MKPHHHRKRNIRQGLALHVTLKTTQTVFVSKVSRRLVDRLLVGYSKYFKVKVYHRAVLGNHIHLSLKPHSRESLAGFLRVLTGQLAARLKLKTGSFWLTRPWSRVLQWGKDFHTAQKYVALNYLESIGKVIRSKNKSNLKVFGWLISEVLAKGWTVPGMQAA